MKWLSVLALVGLAACGAFQVPVSGQIGDEPAQGTASARLNGDGDFWVMTTAGLRCDGSYDALDSSPTIAVPIRCTDGRTGNLIITRSMDMASGTAIGRLSDGSEGRFVFGNLRFETAFASTMPL